MLYKVYTINPNAHSKHHTRLSPRQAEAIHAAHGSHYFTMRTVSRRRTATHVTPHVTHRHATQPRTTCQKTYHAGVTFKKNNLLCSP